MMAAKSTPDATKMFEAIAAIISRREGKKVKLTEVRKKGTDIVRKVG